MKVLALLFCLLLICTTNSNAQAVWQTNLDGAVRFYQTTDFGIVLTGTENSLYAVDGQTGETAWRRRTKGLDETSIVPVPGTDVVLVSSDEGSKSRLEAVDLLSGASLWRSDKVKGDVMQLAVEPQNDLVAVVLVKKAKGKTGEEFKRTPVIHVFRLSSGDELWKKDLESDVQMMPTRFDSDGAVAYTLNNYRPPLILDGKLYLFYEGATSFDAETGREVERERFKINEGGLALTEADPVFDDRFLYTTGRGRVRAVNRQNGKVEWEAKDLGVTPEMAIVGDVLYVRTGGQFTGIKNGEIEEKGSFGVSAIDTQSGKTIWRYKGADKGLTNFIIPNQDSIFVADKDELSLLSLKTGRRLGKIKHDIKNAQFVIANERGEIVVGGSEELAAFGQPIDIQGGINREESGFREALWRVKHKAPGRGILRTVAGIALRATALYFRYGGLATSALNFARGANAARSILSLRWSGVRNNFSSFDLTTLAVNSAKNYATNQISLYGIASRTPNLLNRINGLQNVAQNLPGLPNAANIRGRIIGGAINRATPSRADVQESLLDRLDPTRQLDKLSNYFLRRKRLADLRGNYMYFYTDLPKPFDKKGLIGVNVHTGADARFVLTGEPDARFVTDETVGLLYSANGSRLQAFDVLNR